MFIDLSRVRFETPYAFFLLLLIPVIIAIHQFQRERMLIKSSAYSIWEEVFNEIKPKNTLVQMLRNILIYLHIFFVLFLSIAIANPHYTSSIPSDKKIAILIDNSASMSTVEDGVTRLERAKSAAIELIKNGKNRSILVSTTVDSINGRRFDGLFTDDQEKITRRILSITQSSSSENIDKALDNIRLVGKNSLPIIYYIGDGNRKSTAKTLRMTKNIVIIPIGNEKNNLGIINLSSRFIPQINKKREIRVLVKNFGTVAVSNHLELTLGKRNIFNRDITLNAMKSLDFALKLPAGETGVLKARLLNGDNYKNDNTAFHIIEPLNLAKVTVVANTYPRNILSSLRIQKDIAVDVLSEKGFKKQALTGELEDSIGVFYRVLPDYDPFLSTVFINPGFGRTKAYRVKELPAWRRQHPIVENISFSSFFVGNIYPVPSTLAKVNISPILSAEMPLIYSSENKGKKTVIFTFDAEAAGLSMQPSFPILLRRIIQWFNINTVPENNLNPGDIFHAYLDKNEDTAYVLSPDSKKNTIKLINGNIIFAETAKSGIYRVKSKDKELLFSVKNDPAESDISPKLPRNNLVGKAKKWTVTEPFVETWKLLSACAFVLLMCEWWYQKKGIYALY